MKRIITIIIFCSLVSVSSVFSQQRGHFSVTYDISFGTGDLGDYISKASFRGISAQYRYAATHSILVGVDAGWYVFYERKDYDTYTQGTQSLSGIQYRTQNEVPILVCADYLFLPDGKVKPYIGVGIGTLYSERSTDMGTWRLQENPWHFAIKPEVGLMYDVSHTTALQLAGKYYTGFKAGDLETQGYFTISIGLAFGF